jgi:hypothetical protein
MAQEYSPRSGWLHPLFKSIDALCNLWAGGRLRLWQRRSPLPQGVTVQRVEEVDDETESFIQKRNRTELTRRGRDELNWMINYPWVVADPARKSEAARYYFSSVADRFSFECLQVRDAKMTMLGFVILRIRGSHVAVPYACFDPPNATLIAQVICREVVNLNASRLTLYNPLLLKCLEGLAVPTVYRRHKIRTLVVSDHFSDIDLSVTQLQDGDGDCAFT